MMLISVCSLGGAPGATTLALAVAAAWRATHALPMFVEADVSGGDVGAWRRLPLEVGLLTLAAQARTRTAVAPPEEGMLLRHSQRMPGGLHAVLAPSAPHLVEPSVALLVRQPGVLRQKSTVTIVDIGRMVPGSAGAQLAARTDAVVVVADADVAQLRRIRDCADILAALPERGVPVGLAVVGEGFSDEEITGQTGMGVWSRVPHDTAAAEFLRGTRSVSRVERRPLMRAARALGARVHTAHAERQQRLRDLVAEGGRR